VDSLIVIGASTGGVEALTKIVSGIPAGFPAAILVVMHIGEHRSVLPTVLGRHCALPVRHAQHGELVQPGIVLIAPPDRHMLVQRLGPELRIVLTRGPKENHSRPAIDTLFRSAAVACGPAAIGVILTGYLDDGTVGLQAIKRCGGTAIVQDPKDAMVPDMPGHALENTAVDRCMPLAEIAAGLVDKVSANAAAPLAENAPVPDWVDIENNFALGAGDMQQLKKIARPSRYSCPECGGALFQLNTARPCRFRCHTGHSYTLLALVEEQDAVVEASLAAALRALQEKESLAEQLATEFLGRSTVPAPAYLALARQARADASVLRQLLARQQNGGTLPDA
jgi:two-component system chemotaxis response regulator CheB